MNQERRNSLAISIFLCANPLSWILPVPNIIIIITFLCWGLIIINKQLLNILRIPFYVHLFILFLIGAFLISLNINFKNESGEEYFFSFIIFGITGIIFSHLNFSISYFFKYLSIIAICLVPFVYRIDFGDVNKESIDYGVWMGVSYGILRLFLGLVILFLLYKDKYNFIWKLAAFLALIAYIGIYAQYASRGAILAIGIFLMSYYLIKKTLSIQKKLAMIFLSIIAVFLLFNFKEVIIFINEILSSYGIKISFLLKIEQLLKSGDLDNGRGGLIGKGMKGIMESPVFGNGISGFENEYGTGYYVHNVIIQMLYEGGVIYFVPFLIILIGSIFLIYRSKLELERRIFLLFLFCAGMLELFFSSVYWRSLFFWFFVFYSLKTLIDYYKRRAKLKI